MIELVRRLAVIGATGLVLATPAWADEPLHGQVIGVAGGDVITLVDAQQREHRLRLAFIDVPVLGQPFGDEAQTALAAMTLGRQVTVQFRGHGEGGAPQVEVVEPHGRLVNLELVKRGLAWVDDFSNPPRPERSQYQAALATAQQDRVGMWSLNRLELPRDYRSRVDHLRRWWLYVAYGLGGFVLLGLIFTRYDKRISAWIERQDAQIKSEAEAYRLARIRAEAEQAERDRIREIADREMDRLAAERWRRELA